MAKENNSNIPFSLEMEKPARANKDELFQSLPYVVLVFISKECASSFGGTSMGDAVHVLHDVLPTNTCIVCPRGEKLASGNMQRATFLKYHVILLNQVLHIIFPMYSSYALRFQIII